MASGLLKAHTYIWFVLLLAVPTLMFFSVRNLNFNERNNTPVEESEIVGDIIAVDENPQFRTVLYDSPRGRLLELVVKQPLQSASAILYPVVDGERAEKSLGQISTQGSHTFLVEDRFEQFQLFDPIKNEIIIEIEF